MNPREELAIEVKIAVAARIRQVLASASVSVDLLKQLDLIPQLPGRSLLTAAARLNSGTSIQLIHDIMEKLEQLGVTKEGRKNYVNSVDAHGHSALAVIAPMGNPTIATYLVDFFQAETNEAINNSATNYPSVAATLRRSSSSTLFIPPTGAGQTSVSEPTNVGRVESSDLSSSPKYSK
jgi:hypothetical protein